MKTLLVGFLMLAGFSSAQAAVLNVRSGPALAIVDLNGVKTDTAGLIGDAELLFHRKYISWGLGMNHLTAGGHYYTGGSLLLGYYSDKTNTKEVNWHVLGSFGGGAFSENIPASFFGLNIGTNYLVEPPQKGKRSSLALTFDMKLGRAGGGLLGVYYLTPIIGLNLNW